MRIENKLRRDLSKKRGRAQRQCDIWGMITEGGAIWWGGGPAIGGTEGRGGERGNKLLWGRHMTHGFPWLQKPNKKERNCPGFYFCKWFVPFYTRQQFMSAPCALEGGVQLSGRGPGSTFTFFPYDDPVTRHASITNDREPLFAHCCSWTFFGVLFKTPACLKKNN